MPHVAEVIDDMRQEGTAERGADWKLISDGVMGGLSDGVLRHEQVRGRTAVRMQGQVRLENNGGFLQFARDLAPGGDAVDARGWSGIALAVSGNGASYSLHLRTTALTRPWQSYRHAFTAPRDWVRLRLPFTDFKGHRTDQPLDLSRLRRIGIVAIGRAFEADIALADIRFYRADG